MDRKPKIEELLESFGALRRTMSFRTAGKSKTPRITPSQWGALMVIGHTRGSAVKDIARSLRISSSAATQLVDGLVASGYVVKEKDPKDNRTALIILSQKTKGRMESMKRKGVQRFLKAFKVLNDREFEQYCALNQKILAGFLRK